MSAPRSEIGELWRAISREIHDRLRQAFRGCELHFSVLILLRQIDREPGVTLVELSRRSGLVKSQVSKMVDQLVGSGYVQKRADPDDQRLVRIYVTPSGAGTMAELEERAQGVWSAVVGEVPAGELEDVARGLRLLLAAVRKANEKVDEDA